MLRLGTVYPQSVPFLGELAPTVISGLNSIFDSRVLVVPGKDGFDSLKKREIDALITFGGFYYKEMPDFASIFNIPFGLKTIEHIAWLRSSEGRQLLSKVENRYHVKILPLCTLSAQLFGWWSSNPVMTGFVGKKVRVGGFAEPIIERLGMIPVDQSLNLTELKQALKENRIDGVEYADPFIDSRSGMASIAQTTLIPGWHEPGTLIGLVIEGEIWNSLPEDKKIEIILWTDQYSIFLTDLSLKNQCSALQELKEKEVLFQTIPPTVLRSFKLQWEEYVAQSCNHLFKEIVTSVTQFSANIEIQNFLNGED